MSIKLVKWPSTVKFSRGEVEKKTFEYSTAGEDGEEVEVPQINEELNGVDFWNAIVGWIGGEDESKKILNKTFGLAAIKEGQTKFKASHKKTGVMDKAEATKQAIQTVKEYVPTLTKERGAVVTEAFQKAGKMDALAAARLKVARGEMEEADFFAMLDEVFSVEEAS